MHGLAHFRSHGGRRGALTNCDQVVGVNTLQVGGHLLHPGLNVLVAAHSITAWLVDEIPRHNDRILPVHLRSPVRRL